MNTEVETATAKLDLPTFETLDVSGWDLFIPDLT